MTDDQEKLVKRLAEMSAAFEAGLPDRIAGLRRSFEDAKAGEDTKAGRPNNQVQRSLEKLHAQAHKFAGASGTFGFSQIGDMARRLEALCLELIERGEFRPDEDAEAIGELIDAMGAAGEGRSDFSVEEAAAWSLDLGNREVARSRDKTVVLVDDDRGFVHLLTEQLIHFGYQVVALEECAELQGVLESRPVSLVLMDVVFPGESDAGFTTVKTLKEEGLLECPVVFVSFRSDFEARLNAVQIGCDDYLVKPFDIADLVDALDRLTRSTGEAAFRVLLVDDDKEVAERNALLLNQAGMETAVVTDPRAALAVVGELRPDAVLMDINMPGCDGFELAAIIRQERDFVQIPIVFLTAEGGLDRQIRGMISGGDGFLEKTVSADFLIATVLSRAKHSRRLSTMILRQRESERRFRAVAETAQEAIVTVDEQGRIVFWNTSAERTFGFAAPEVLGSQFIKLIAERYRFLFAAAGPDRGRAIGDGKVEIEGIRQDGSELPIEISVADWVMDERAYFTAIVHDIGERKVMEAHLAQAQKTEAVAKLTGGVAHDFNNLLQVITTNLFFLEQDIADGSKQSDMVKMSLAAAQRGADLTHRLLAYTQQQMLVPKLVDLNELLEEVVAELRPTLAETIEIELRTADEMLMCKLDNDHLRSALLNLAVNACDAMPEGGRLRFETRVLRLDEGDADLGDELPPGDYLAVAARDTGSGVEKEVLGRVFEPFFTTKGMATNQGLGLSMVYGFARQSGGRAVIESEVGVGTTARLILPKAEPAETRHSD